MTFKEKYRKVNLLYWIEEKQYHRSCWGSNSYKYKYDENYKSTNLNCLLLIIFHVVLFTSLFLVRDRYTIYIKPSLSKSTKYDLDRVDKLNTSSLSLWKLINISLIQQSNEPSFWDFQTALSYPYCDKMISMDDWSDKLVF